MILGLGGYAAGPAIVAGSDLKIPTALFNPDATPGRANQYLAPKVDRVFVQWYDTIDLIGRSRKISCTGCPVRPEFANVDQAKDVRAMALGLTMYRQTTVLVTGLHGGCLITAALAILAAHPTNGVGAAISSLTTSYDFALPAGVLAFSVILIAVQWADLQGNESAHAFAD